MRKICKEKLKLERFELPRAEAIKFMEEKDEPFKVELINDLPEDADHQLLQAGRVHRPLRRSAPRLHRPHQGQRHQADRLQRRLLARRLEPRGAPAHLRRRFPKEGRAGRLPQRARGGRQARPQQARPRARIFHHRRLHRSGPARCCCPRARASCRCSSAGSRIPSRSAAIFSPRPRSWPSATFTRSPATGITISTACSSSATRMTRRRSASPCAR